MQQAISALLTMCGVYLAIGLFVALRLHAGVLRRLDPSMDGAGWVFRVLITPGLVGLWPLMLHRWMALRRGTPLPLPYERPLTATQLRVIHRHATALLAVIAPAIVVTALLTRPAPIPQSHPYYQSQAPEMGSGDGPTLPLVFTAAGNPGVFGWVRTDYSRAGVQIVDAAPVAAIANPTLYLRSKAGSETMSLGPVYPPDRDVGATTVAPTESHPWACEFRLPFWAAKGDRLILGSGVTGDIYAEATLP